MFQYFANSSIAPVMALPVALFLTWFNLNHNIDKESNAQESVVWNNLSITKL